jgi:putative sigma-54 modulation protein
MNETTTNMFPIHVTPHHLSLSPALRDFACQQLTKVQRFCSDALAEYLVLRRHHGTADGKRFSASARLAFAGPDIHATATHADLYTAIVKLVARLARLSRKRKTRLAKLQITRNDHASQALSRSLNENKTPRFTAPESALSAIGEMRQPRRRDGGQERRVFGFRRTSPFAFNEMWAAQARQYS